VSIRSLLGLKSKYYFWFGSEAVPAQSLNHYLASSKPEFTQPTAAWSSQTGEGILYFVKNKDAKETPAGALLLVRRTTLCRPLQMLTLLSG
jgi:hypothetical protein